MEIHMFVFFSIYGASFFIRIKHVFFLRKKNNYEVIELEILFRAYFYFLFTFIYRGVSSDPDRRRW